MASRNKNCKYSSFLLSINGSFPQQGPRPTCDCISGPRLIPAVSWGYPAYIMRALLHVGLPISGNQEDAQSHHHGSSEPTRIARARRMPFGLNVKGGEVSSPTHPAHLDYSSSRIDARNQRSPGAL